MLPEGGVPKCLERWSRAAIKPWLGWPGRPRGPLEHKGSVGRRAHSAWVPSGRHTRWPSQWHHDIVPRQESHAQPHWTSHSLRVEWREHESSHSVPTSLTPMTLDIH